MKKLFIVLLLLCSTADANSNNDLLFKINMLACSIGYQKAYEDLTGKETNPDVKAKAEQFCTEMARQTTTF